MCQCAVRLSHADIRGEEAVLVPFHDPESTDVRPVDEAIPVTCRYLRNPFIYTGYYSLSDPGGVEC